MLRITDQTLWFDRMAWCHRLSSRVRVAAILCLTLVAIGVGECQQAEAADKVTAKLFVSDVLTLPREEVTLEARLVKEGLLRAAGLGGEQLEFYVGGIKAGTALTGGDGRARCCKKPFSSPMRGNQVIRVKLSGSPRVDDIEATGTFFGWERRRPILLVDLAALVGKGKLPVGLPAIPLQMGLQKLPSPLPEAPTHLERLTKYFYNVVYVSQSGSVGLESLRAWLREHKFPAGVPKVGKPGKRGIVAVLEDLKEQGFGNIGAGIGRTRDFAETFAERRMKVVILSESGEARNFPRKTQWAKDWLEIRKRVQG